MSPNPTKPTKGITSSVCQVMFLVGNIHVCYWRLKDRRKVDIYVPIMNEHIIDIVGFVGEKGPRKECM